MAGKKYAHCIKSGALLRSIPHYTGQSIVAHEGELDVDCSIGYHCISKKMSFDEPHTHDFHETLCFIGGDPQDINDLGAEIEFTLGGEKHLITSATVVSIPPALEHCPIVFKKVTKPLIFLEISRTRNWKSGKTTKKESTRKAKK